MANVASNRGPRRPSHRERAWSTDTLAISKEEREETEGEFPDERQVKCI